MSEAGDAEEVDSISTDSATINSEHKLYCEARRELQSFLLPFPSSLMMGVNAASVHGLKKDS